MVNYDSPDDGVTVKNTGDIPAGEEKKKEATRNMPLFAMALKSRFKIGQSGFGLGVSEPLICVLFYFTKGPLLSVFTISSFLFDPSACNI